MTAMSQKQQSDDTAGEVCRAVTDEELDALVSMLQQRDKSRHGYTGHPLYNRNGLQAADAITTLRAQLADANARADREEFNAAQLTVMVGEDAVGQIEAALAAQQLAEARADRDKWFEGWGTMHVAAMREAQRADQNAIRADRAEAALAAQIEVDAEICTYIIENYDCMKADKETYQPMWVQKVAKGMVSLARQDIRNQPHDRTALDAVIRAAKVEAWKEAAGVAANACLVDPDGGNPTEEERLVCEEAYRRILALIEREATHA